METIHRREAAAARRRYAIVLLAMLAVLILATLLSFWIGYYPLSPGDVVRAFLARFGVDSQMDPNAVTIFWNIRLPRILSAVFIGASLSVAGASYQSMFRNPLVSPDILGVSSGASLGAAIAILCGRPNYVVQLAAFIGGVSAVAVAMVLTRKEENRG